ncbi:hypothetical protein O6H91_Y449400 [Diphasiastrum complanatum]|nr:hypothetical protein O6H91_Y449400 [Diphasiastrum complanatum]
METYSVMPPGFRFHPTDEELVGYYLFKKVSCEDMDTVDVIPEIDLYKIEPWDLEEKCRISSVEQNEWYFFSHKHKKYPTGTRTNRATTSGFWKATGRDKFIYANNGVSGMRKTLVYYRGRAPNGQKTEWIMHEHRLGDVNNINEDGWAVCRVFKKRNTRKGPVQFETPSCYEEETAMSPELESTIQILLQNGHYGECASTCKQEIQLEFCKSRDQNFSKLPQLESPKNSFECAAVSCSAQYSLANDINGLISSAQTLEFETSSVDDHEHFISSLHHDQYYSILHEVDVTEWSIVDGLVGKKQTQEEHCRFEEPRLPTELSESSKDNAMVGILCKMEQNPADFLTSCDIDLWNFGK